MLVPKKEAAEKPAFQPVSGGLLANTGASVMGLVGLAIALMVAGAFIALRRREA